jgi:hypothetical protein
MKEKLSAVMAGTFGSIGSWSPGGVRNALIWNGDVAIS